jgi:hypothetical protein
MSENDPKLRAYRHVQGERALTTRNECGLFGAAVMDRATATQTGQGNYTAALLQPLPAKMSQGSTFMIARLATLSWQGGSLDEGAMLALLSERSQI